MDYSLVPIHGTYPPISQWDGGGGPVIMKRPSVLSGTGSEIGGVVCVCVGGVGGGSYWY